jgi:hypothetical protein
MTRGNTHIKVHMTTPEGPLALEKELTQIAQSLQILLSKLKQSRQSKSTSTEPIQLNETAINTDFEQMVEAATNTSPYSLVDKATTYDIEFREATGPVLIVDSSPGEANPIPVEDINLAKPPAPITGENKEPITEEPEQPTREDLIQVGLLADMVKDIRQRVHPDHQQKMIEMLCGQTANLIKNKRQKSSESSRPVSVMPALSARSEKAEERESIIEKDRTESPDTAERKTKQLADIAERKMKSFRQKLNGQSLKDLKRKRKENKHLLLAKKKRLQKHVNI